jgi:hypothetical protein
MARAGASHQLIGVDAPGDVLPGVLSAGRCEVKALHLAAVDRLSNAPLALGMRGRGDRRGSHVSTPLDLFCYCISIALPKTIQMQFGA